MKKILAVLFLGLVLVSSCFAYKSVRAYSKVFCDIETKEQGLISVLETDDSFLCIATKDDYSWLMTQGYGGIDFHLPNWFLIQVLMNKVATKESLYTSVCWIIECNKAILLENIEIDENGRLEIYLKSSTYELTYEECCEQAEKVYNALLTREDK